MPLSNLTGGEFPLGLGGILFQAPLLQLSDILRLSIQLALGGAHYIKVPYPRNAEGRDQNLT